MGIYDSIDVDWTWDGDYMVGPDGDIKDTTDDYLRSIQNEIATIVGSDLMDWEMDPSIGCNLSDFVGEPNTRLNGKKIEDRVRFKLIDSGIVNPDDLTVRVVPVGIHEVAILIGITTLATSNNKLQAGETINVGVLFDTIERTIFVEPAQLKFGFGYQGA